MAQFVETECPIRHPEQNTAKLVGATALEDGTMAHYLPEYYLVEKDGSKVGIFDYRLAEDLRYRHARMQCWYDKAPDVFVDVPGLMTRCVFHFRHLKKMFIYIRAYCESDISPPSETAVKSAGQ